jgi:hypothetical protein
MAATAQQHLDAVNDAITAALGGKAQGISLPDGKIYTSFPLKDLYALREKFQREVNRASKGMFSVGKFGNPS